MTRAAPDSPPALPPAGAAADASSAEQRFLARRAARRRADRARWLRPLLALVVLTVLAATGFWVVWFSSWMTAREVTIVGTHRLRAEQVRAIAAVPMDTPLARIDLGAIEARVGTIPGVRGVSASRSWPDEIRIAVEERQPAVAVPESGRYLLVDFDAVAFQTVSAPPEGVPRLRANPSGLQADTVRATVTILEAMPRSVRGRVAEVVAASAEDVTLVLRDRTRIVWGSSADSARKADVLRALLRRPGTVYDVSSPDAPAVQG
ncbi:MAG TPA: FtsQ-type POTRA domain-containing protein [Actinomycetes bacterium]|nr:FtsQ-type POTRA domain-containing protein [Actinomycetes bacterium]